MTAVPLPVCFWCGRDQVEAGGFQRQAIERVVMGYGFCNACKALSAAKVVCIEVDRPDATGNPPFQDEPPFDRLSPTGRWIVADVDAFQDLPFPPGVIATALKSKRTLIEKAVFDKMFTAHDEPVGGETP